MSLVTKLFDQVEAEARKDGGRIRGRGDVSILEHSANRIEAAVFAGNTYGVVLERERSQLVYSCDCNDYRESLDPCKHVWATIVEADASGYLAGWERGRDVELLPANDFDEDDEDVDEPRETFVKPILAARDATMQKPSRTFPAAQADEARRGKKPAEDWKSGFSALRRTMNTSALSTGSAWPAGKDLLYVVDVEATGTGNGLTIELLSRERKRNGEWGKPKREAIGLEDCDRLPDPADQAIIAMICGAKQVESGYYYSGYGYRSSRFRPHHSQYAMIVEQMCQTGRCFFRLATQSNDLHPLAWDGANRWEFALKIERDEATGRFVISGELRKGEDRMKVNEPVLLVPGLLFTPTHAMRFDAGDAYPWVLLLRERQTIEAPASAGEELLSQLLSLPRVPNVELPHELKYERITVAPRPRLRLRKSKQHSYYAYDNPKLDGELTFDYQGQMVRAEDDSPGIYHAQDRRFIERDRGAERAAEARLHSLGFREARGYYHNDDRPRLQLNPNQLPSVIRVLTAEGWYVEADGHLYRQPGELRVELSSGIDWFELHGTAEFGDQQVSLPELLRALHRGEKSVRLGDGTFGVLPEEWLKKYGLLAGMGEAEGDHIKFGKSQVGLLDALLAAQPQITFDEVFEQARQRLRAFAGIKPAQPPATFVGTLRPYQCEGLGWLGFLREFGFGGCLADDMGLGKTVQVLALLEERRTLNASHDGSNGNGNSQRPGPSLVVAPRSLIFNWTEEARRFAPQLRVIDHTGTARTKSAEVLTAHDLVLTTYGTLRNDITFLKDIRFDYAVLDEAQAIKNAASESAKASRLLNAGHRLALSGTPVQNHLGELWSLFEFLNPGMLGSAKVLQMTATGSQKLEADTKVLLSRALRPFILRRTKSQVAKELPQRVEQTIHCELDAAQRKLYNELREHYRQSLLSRIAIDGIKKSKILILEALLRLRQAACHPALIDKTKSNQGSAKLDSLLAQLAEVIDGGHKALVFSQFTSFLALVRKRLDADKISYEYLDGRTRDRQTPVERFQNDPNQKLFLISLKAGGVGLNLTAAEYVFLLDPWWNPAVEAQAIDRAHRIGQTRQVFAYRLIAQDTVEEKVLQLQESKRELADAIISADNSVISRLGREDLELLLS